MANFCAKIGDELFAELQAIKENLGLKNNADILRYLTNFYKNPFKSGLSASQEVEKIVQDELQSPSRKINTYAIDQILKGRGEKPKNRNTVNSVLELYKDEIEAHNSKI